MGPLKSLLCPLCTKPGVYVVLLRRRTRDRFQFPSSVKIRIPDSDDTAYHSYADEVCFYEANFVSGLCFPIHPFVWELFFLSQLSLFQLVPNSWRIVVCHMVIWMFANDEDTIRIDEFLQFYRLRRSKDPSFWEFKPWVGVQGWFLILHRLFEIRKPTFSLSLVMAGNSFWVRTQMTLLARVKGFSLVHVH